MSQLSFGCTYVLFLLTYAGEDDADILYGVCAAVQSLRAARRAYIWTWLCWESRRLRRLQLQTTRPHAQESEESIQRETRCKLLCYFESFNFLLQSLWCVIYLPQETCNSCHFYRTMLSAVYAVVVCLCVCLSVTLRYCIKAAKCRITQIMPATW